MFGDHIARFFKRDYLSDAEVVIRLGLAPEEGQKSQTKSAQEEQQQHSSHAQLTGECLARMPVHQLVLFAADYFKAQVRSWPQSQVELQQGPKVATMELQHKRAIAPLQTTAARYIHAESLCSEPC
jgi:hypothetical protein